MWPKQWQCLEESQRGDRQNVITNMKICDTELTGTGRQAHAVNHCIQHSVGSVEVDNECTTAFNVHGFVHHNNILIYIQQDATLHSLFYLETAVHVSGGTITHHQEHKRLYLQHLVFVTPLLLSAAIVEELERV